MIDPNQLWGKKAVTNSRQLWLPLRAHLEETRKMILKTASEMGYLPNSSARTLKTKRSYNIGVMFVDEAASGLTHDYFNHVLESFKRTAEE